MENVVIPQVRIAAVQGGRWRAGFDSVCGM